MVFNYFTSILFKKMNKQRVTTNLSELKIMQKLPLQNYGHFREVKKQQKNLIKNKFSKS